MAENPSAFPLNAANLGGPGAYAPDPGMTLRDWFAGQCLSGIMSQATGMGQVPEADRKVIWEQCSGLVYELADAMLAARATQGDA